MIKKYTRRIAIIVVITIMIFAIGMMILKYQVEGETNMPFQLSKISIISSSEGVDKETTQAKWTFDINQHNDVYLYIDKNKEYNQTKAIKTVKIEHMQIQEAASKENIKFYKPDNQEEKVIFKNKEENIVENIEYTGELESNLKQLKISNQGGLAAFRCSNNQLACFTSNDDQINHNELLKKAGITKEQLQLKINFDLRIKVEEGNEYLATIHLDFPVEDIIEKGVTSKEITQTKDIIFKRVT